SQDFRSRRHVYRDVGPVRLATAGQIDDLNLAWSGVGCSLAAVVRDRFRFAIDRQPAAVLAEANRIEIAEPTGQRTLPDRLPGRHVPNVNGVRSQSRDEPAVGAHFETLPGQGEAGAPSCEGQTKYGCLPVDLPLPVVPLEVAVIGLAGSG